MTWTAEMNALDEIGELGMNLECSYDIASAEWQKQLQRLGRKGING